MKLKDHVNREQGLSDKLNYAHLIDEGVILNKDGAFLVTYRFKGPDTFSATEGELDALTQSVNRMALYLEDGWMLHMDEIRKPSTHYPDTGYFPDSVSKLIDEERRQLYEEEGLHYENTQYLTFVWKFPIPLIKTARHWFVEGLPKGHDQSLKHLYSLFCEKIERCIGILSAHLQLEKLESSALLSFLNTCITGEFKSLNVPPKGCFIDVALGRHPLVGGYIPRIGSQYIYTLSIVGYLNHETIPSLLDSLGTYPLVYRFSNRFIALSQATAEREIKRYQKGWLSKVKGFLTDIYESLTDQDSNQVDKNAKKMGDQTEDAIEANASGEVRFGFWSGEVVLIHEDLILLEEAAKEITSRLEQNGFSCTKEEPNALDAWFGTIPGHGSCNMRRLFIDSKNLAHLLPLHTIWTGSSTSSSLSLLPKNSPPVFYAATTGKTPFRFHLDVGDVGHQVVLGPTGTGKSTYLGFMMAQFLRYPNAKLFVFDKNKTHQGVTEALSGHFYDIGKAENLSFAPLADLSTPTKVLRAERFIEECVALQNVHITPHIRNEIHIAIQSLLEDQNKEHRTLTVFRCMVQNMEVRDALRFYTLEGTFPLMDAANNSLKEGHLHTFEIGWLLSQPPEIYIPVLNYLLDGIESYLEEAQGQSPVEVIFEEAWLPIKHPFFAERIKDRIKTGRAKNERLILATQSLADLYDPATEGLTPITATILDCCPTKIYLPNPYMEEETQKLYQKMGLSSRQIEIIKEEAIPKQNYYVVTPSGNRLIDLGLASSDMEAMALEFIRLSPRKTAELMACKEKWGKEWVYHWLDQQGFQEWGELWLNEQKMLLEAGEEK